MKEKLLPTEILPSTLLVISSNKVQEFIFSLNQWIKFIKVPLCLIILLTQSAFAIKTLERVSQSIARRYMECLRMQKSPGFCGSLSMDSVVEMNVMFL